jgi:hypothetical protein
MDAQVENIIFELLRLGIAEQEGPTLQLTLVGFACANSSLSYESVTRLLTLDKSQRMGALSLERLLALTQVLPELDDTYTPMFRNGNKEKTWPFQAVHRIGNDMVLLYQRFLPDQLAYQRRAKRALTVADWMDGMTMEDLERTYTNSPNAPFSAMSYGDVRRIAEATRYHFRSVVPIMQALHPDLLLDDEAVTTMSARLEFGLPDAALPMLKVPTLTRGEILLFMQHGITDPTLLWESVAPVALLLFEEVRHGELATLWKKSGRSNP